MKPRESTPNPAETTATDSVASVASMPIDPTAGGSFIRQPDGSLQRNPAHPELKQQLVRRPPTPAS